MFTSARYFDLVRWMRDLLASTGFLGLLRERVRG